MTISRVSNPSFCGIKKVVTYILPVKAKKLQNISASIQKGIYKPLKEDTFVPSKKAKPRSLIKMTQFFNKDRLVGTHYQFVDGSYSGNRIFADGTQITYNATNLGNGFYVAGTRVKSKDIIGGHISHDAYDKKGRPAIPTLKMIKNYTDPKRIERLEREGKIVDVTGEEL